MGTVFFAGKNVTFGKKSQLVIIAQEGATATSGGSSSIEGIGTLTMNGTVRIIPAPGNTLHEGDSIRIWQATKTGGTPQLDIQGDIVWDTSRISEGLLFVKDTELGVSRPTPSPPSGREDIYDLSGRTSGSPCRHGIYIQKGKKIVK